jgi:hypothetical protein
VRAFNIAFWPVCPLSLRVSTEKAGIVVKNKLARKEKGGVQMGLGVDDDQTLLFGVEEEAISNASSNVL